MAKFAPVVPLSIVESMWHTGILGDYHLLLAHDVVSSPEAEDGYSKYFYYRMRSMHPKATIIMDNSVVELGEAFDFEHCFNAAVLVQADYLVAADAFLESKLTLARSAIFADDFRHMRDHGSIGLMGVVQGRTLEECMVCAEYYAHDELFRGIAVPRCLTPVLGSRMSVLLEIQRRLAGRFDCVHMLGFSDDLVDDIACARLPFVNGIDSAAPIRGALKGIQVQLPHTDFGPRGDFWQTTYQQGWDALAAITDNVNTVRQLIDV